MATISKKTNIASSTLREPLNDKSITSLPSMYSFIFMNVARLLTQTKRKNEVLSDLCDRSTLFLCLCETFLHEGILDSEIKISGFSIISLSSFLSLTNRPRNFVNRSPSRNDVREISLKLPPLSGQRITCQLSTSNNRARIMGQSTMAT